MGLVKRLMERLLLLGKKLLSKPNDMLSSMELSDSSSETRKAILIGNISILNGRM